MDKCVRYDKKDMPKFKYFDEYPNLEIDGNVIEQSIFDKISTVFEIYGVIGMFTIEQLTNAGINLEDIALNPDDAETDNNTISFFDLVSLMPSQNNVNFGEMIQALGMENMSSRNVLAGLLTLFYVISNPESFDSSWANLDINNPSNFATQLLELSKYIIRLNRFASRKIDVLIPDIDQSNGKFIIYALEECSLFINKVKLVKYDLMDIPKFQALLNGEYTPQDGDPNELIFAKILYDNENIKETKLMNLLPMFYVGEPTSYAILKASDKYEIAIDGFSNDYGTFSNVKSVTIRQKFETPQQDENSNEVANKFSYDLKYSGNRTNNGGFFYTIYNCYEIPTYVGITVDPAFAGGDLDGYFFDNMQIDEIDGVEYYNITEGFVNRLDKLHGVLTTTIHLADNAPGINYSDFGFPCTGHYEETELHNYYTCDANINDIKAYMESSNCQWSQRGNDRYDRDVPIYFSSHDVIIWGEISITRDIEQENWNEESGDYEYEYGDEYINIHIDLEYYDNYYFLEYDYSDIILLYNSNETPNNASQEEYNNIPNTAKIMFMFEGVGEKIESFLNDDESTTVEGSIIYSIPQNPVKSIKPANIKTFTRGFKELLKSFDSELVSSAIQQNLAY